MTLQDLIDTLHLEVLTTPQDFRAITPTCGYVSDLLSCVMTGAKPGGIWITLQAHLNILAVAALTEQCAILITEGARPEPPVIAKANAQGIILLLTAAPSFDVVGKLWEMGLRSG